MSDFKLNSDGDLDISSGGFEIVEGADAIVQELGIRMRQVQGNWFLDLLQGLPYFSQIFVNGPNEADLYSIYAAEMKAADNVLKVKQLQLLDITDSNLQVIGEVLTTKGVVTVGTSAL